MSTIDDLLDVAENNLLAGIVDKKVNDELNHFISDREESVNPKEAQDYWYFKGVISWARALNCLGRGDDALKLINRYYEKLMKMDEEIRKSISADSKLSDEEKIKTIRAASFMAGIRYTKGMIFFIKAHDAIKKQQKKEAFNLLIDSTGAGAQFYNCATKNTGSSEAFKSIIRYDEVRRLGQLRFQKILKDLPLSFLDQGKAFYSLQKFKQAAKFFEKYKSLSVSIEAFEALYLLIPSYVKSDQIEKVDEILNLMEEKYLKFNKKPKDYFTKMNLYMSGIYKKMMEETKDESKKIEYDKIRTQYYLNTVMPCDSRKSSSVAYALANKSFKNLFNSISMEDSSRIDENLKEVKERYNKIITDFPKSQEASKSYKKLAQINEYFKDWPKAILCQKKYFSSIPSKTIRQRIDKLNCLFAIANIYMQTRDYKSVKTSIEEFKEFYKNHDFQTDSLSYQSELEKINQQVEILSKGIKSVGHKDN